MMQLIIIRHGESDNKEGAYYGWTDAELNSKGIKQAYRLKKKLEGIKIDRVYSSTLKRAAKTAEIIEQISGCGLIYSKRLMERNFGLWEELTYKDIESKYPDENKAWVNDWMNYVIEGGESAVQAFDRTAAFIDELVSSNKNGVNGVYVIITHLGCIRNMIAYLLGMKLDDIWRFKADKGSISKIELDDSNYAYLTLLNG